MRAMFFRAGAILATLHSSMVGAKLLHPADQANGLAIENMLALAETASQIAPVAEPASKQVDDRSMMRENLLVQLATSASASAQVQARAQI